MNDKGRRSCLDCRTTRHSGYARSLSRRGLVDKTFGGLKGTCTLRQVKLRGLPKVDWIFVFSCAAHNLLCGCHGCSPPKLSKSLSRSAPETGVSVPISLPKPLVGADSSETELLGALKAKRQPGEHPNTKPVSTSS